MAARHNPPSPGGSPTGEMRVVPVAGDTDPLLSPESATYSVSSDDRQVRTLSNNPGVNDEYEYVSSDDDDVGDGPRLPFKEKFKNFLKAMGPGIVVMLADTDASCIITAADSGKQWGYSLILIQVLLIPPLYMAQELTVRIGAVRKCGLGVEVKRRFGKGWGWLLVGTLLVTCIGALVSEMTSVAGAAMVLGIPKWVFPLILLVIMLGVVVTGSYRRVELIALVMGLFELVFVATAILAKPNAEQLGKGLITVPVQHSSYLLLFSANIGAVIMPWMICYQTSAVAQKGLRKRQIKDTTLDTAIGAVVTQAIMILVVVSCAATAWNGKYDGSSEAFPDVPSIAAALSTVLGEWTGKILFVIGLCGGAMIGALVVSLTGAWALGEILGIARSLEESPRDAPWFYLSYAVLMVIGFVIAISGVNIVLLNVIVQTTNTLMLPIILLGLFLIAKDLPPKYALSGVRMWVYGILFFVIAAIGVVTGIIGLVAVAKNGNND